MGFIAKEKAQVEDRERSGKWSSCSEVTIPVKVGMICLSFQTIAFTLVGKLSWLGL